MDHAVFTCKQHHACLSFVRVHQMSPPQQLRQQTSNCSSILVYRPQKDERLSWPSWLTYSGWFTHISGHPSATSRAQDNKSTSAKDQCSTAGPRNQQLVTMVTMVTMVTAGNNGLAGNNDTQIAQFVFIGQTLFHSSQHKKHRCTGYLKTAVAK